MKRCIQAENAVVTAIYVCGCPDQDRCPIGIDDPGGDVGIGYVVGADGGITPPPAPVQTILDASANVTGASAAVAVTR